MGTLGGIKGFKMKAAIVTIVMIFTFAIATDAKKAEAKAARSRHGDIPRCAEKEQRYTYTSADPSAPYAVKAVATVNDCAMSCHDQSAGKCQYWSVYFPTQGVPDPELIGMCHRFAGEPATPVLVNALGWISGKSGCRNQN